MTLELRFLCRASYALASPIDLGADPSGTRVIGEVTEARFEGERFRASLLGRAAADWAVVQPDGRILADVRLTVQTDDGAVVQVRYLGRGDAATGVVFTAPLFDTGDERYGWLTRIQAIGRGVFDDTSLHYEIYEVV